MKNKKGFSLIEILVTLVILTIITTIAVPTYRYLSKNISEELYCTRIAIIENDAKLWGEDNLSSLQNYSPDINFDDINTISINKLISEGYIKEENLENGTVIDPRTKNPLETDIKVFLKNKVVYAVVPSALSTCQKKLPEPGVSVPLETFSCGNGTNLLKDCIKEDVTSKAQMKSGNPDFNEISTDTDTGMYTISEGSGTSYYFRGTKTLLDNNVIFAGFQWKIVRIDKDGNIKLIYNGTCADNNCAGSINSVGEATQIGTKNFNLNSGNQYYVGYTSMSKLDSPIKEYVENWYTTNLSTYDSYIADAVYCNDRSVVTPCSYGTCYGAFGRLFANNVPSLDCPQEADRYTKSSAIGNGLLKEKVGLLTADEGALAGGKYNIINRTYYLYTNLDYWLLSPFYWNNITKLPYEWIVNNSGVLGYTNVGGDSVTRPVITLSSNTTVKEGNGSEEKPYIVKTS